jgi:hypothetical protein
VTGGIRCGPSDQQVRMWQMWSDLKAVQR